MWLQKSAPLEAINHALEEALDDVTVPSSEVGRLAKTTVKKVGALGASVDFGDAARSARPCPQRQSCAWMPWWSAWLLPPTSRSC